MISIYNETKAGWGIEKVNDSVVRFTKTKERREDNRKPQKRVVSIISYTSFFDSLEKLRSTLAGLKQTEKPVPISNTDKETAVVFNNKEFKPFIAERKYNHKNILLGSIFLGGRKIINVKNDNTFLLEYFILGAEFSFITSFNNEASVLTIDLLDEKTNEVTRYKFSQEAGHIVLKTSTKAYVAPAEERPLNLRIFRPSKPTNLILVHPKDKESLDAIINPAHHTVHVYEKLDDAIKELAAQNYKAVTVYAKCDMGKETATEKQRYDFVVNRLLRRFQTVYKLHQDKKVDKVKF